ncbi:MAG TPA: hypothetical protein VFB37_09920 [Steroidobacteraceae bacterium]|nr:hypothetical protein [Steroidobacteraceae bacterium]
MESKIRHQLELLPERQSPHVEPVTSELIQTIKRRQTFLAAWNFAQDFAGLEHKEVYVPLGIDAAHYTKIRNGTASPPADERFNRYLEIVGNEIPLIWWAESRGYDWLTIRKHRSNEQRRIAELEAENQDLKRAFALAFGQRK